MIPFLAGLLASGVLAYPIYRFLLAIRSRQTVSAHVQEHAHKQGTPTMGGLIVLAGLAGVYGALAALGRTELAFGLAVFTLLLAIVGFVDDFAVPRLMPGKRGLGWMPKLALQFITIAAGLWALQVREPATLVVGVLVIVFFSNAYNFADGLDWLAGTILVAFLAGVLLLSAGGQFWDLGFGLLGAMIPFLYLNRPKAKIFMGDVGSMPLGGILGLFVWALAAPWHLPLLGRVDSDSNYHVSILAVTILSLVMVAELVPVPLQIASVKLFKRKLFPFTPIHHAFQRAGWPEIKVVALFAGTQLFCSLVAFGVGRFL